MLTGHGKLKTYYHRFKIIDYSTCICGEEAKQHTTCFMTANSIVKKGCN
jgi:hypothetical protein